MVKTVRLYIEGDKKEKGKGGFISLRQGFNEFFNKWADEENLKIKFDNNILGSRGDAVNIFLKIGKFHPNDLVLLLIDTEREKDKDKSAKLFLQEDFPNSDFTNIKDSQCHFMVQAMESWFIADKEKLAACYDNNFKEKALPQQKEVEKISKTEAIEKLKKATRNTKNGKGEYGKGKDSGKILGKIRPHKVITAAPHCERLFKTIIETLK